MIRERNVFYKRDGDRSGELALACYVTRHSVSAIAYDVGLSRVYARSAAFGYTLTAENAAEPIALAIGRVLRGGIFPQAR